MVELLIQFLLSALGIVIAGVFLVRSTDSIAEQTGLGRLFAGSIFLAAATSLPELFVDISAIKKNTPNLAVGDLMGSSLFNLLILAVSDIIHRQRGKIFSSTSGSHALTAAMSINVTALAGIAIFLGPKIKDISIGELGLGSLSIGITYILGLRLVFNDQRLSIAKEAETTTRNNKKLFRSIIIYIFSALGILIAVPYLADSAAQLAEITGLGSTFMGTTLVAFCTSLPEIVSTLTAIRTGAFDLAVGNIFGSNSFNMILLVPLDFFHPGPLLAMASPIHILTALATIFATSVAIMGQLYQVEKRKNLIEADAFSVIFIVVGTLLLLYYVGVG